MSDYRGYPPQQQIIYQQVVRAPSNGSSVTALVLGLVAIFFGVWIPVPFFGLFMMFLAFIPAVLAVVFGHIGTRNARASNVGRGRSLAGVSLGYVTLGLSVATTIVWILAAAFGASSSSVTGY